MNNRVPIIPAIPVRPEEVVARKIEPNAPASRMMFERAFLCNHNQKLDTSLVLKVARSTVYLCDMPMHIDFIGEEADKSYDLRIMERLMDFSPSKDVMMLHGDPLIFALAITYLMQQYEEFWIARFSSRVGGYVSRKLSSKHLVPYED